MAGDTLYVSGQLGFDAQKMGLVEGVEAQARLALTNLSIVVREAGLSIKDGKTSFAISLTPLPFSFQSSNARCS